MFMSKTVKSVRLHVCAPSDLHVHVCQIHVHSQYTFLSLSLSSHCCQEHIDRAIELRPEEPILHYLNGRWCFEVAGLSWLEKKAAAALFATPPEATYEQALGFFMKSEELSPGTWKANMLMVAKVRK